MVPNVIVIDEEASEDGAEIYMTHIKVREANKEKLIEGLKMVFPDKQVVVLTKKQFQKGSYETEIKKKKTITPIDPNN